MLTSYCTQRMPKIGDAPLPGLLKAKRTLIEGNRTSSADSKKDVFTGFNTVNVKLDVGSSTPRAYEDMLRPSSGLAQASGRATVTAVDLGAALPPSRVNATVQNQTCSVRPDATVEELRNYIVLMDKYSLHNFLIYDGHALKETPEFQSFQRSYQHQWGSIASIVQQLEEFLSKHDVKLAIVNGPRIVQMAKLNLPTLKRGELLSCLANSAQIEANIESGTEFARKQVLRCVISIQAIIRMFLARRRYHWKLKAVRAAIIVQAFARRFIERTNHKHRLKRSATVLDEQWLRNRVKLERWWQAQVDGNGAIATPTHTAAPATSMQNNRSRLVIFLPSISVSERIRLEYDNYAGLQNTSVSQFYQLADPNLTLIYISPAQMTSFQTTYHEKFLSLMGISVLPKRLHILVPEMIDKLPPYLSLAQQLWVSVQTLRKIRSYIKRAKHAEVVCSTMGWAERRIANYLGVPLVGCDPSHAQVLSNRSVLKNLLMEASVSIPIGAHDICGLEDLFVALSRLIAANLGVIRWIIRLNCDHNQEGTAIVDVERMPMILALRNEQREVVGEKESLSAWFARPVQIEVRKRIMTALKTDFLQIVRFCRKDIYPTWDHFLRQVHQLGAVVEAEPLEKLGTVVSPVFITPTGEVQQMGGVEALCDDFGQIQSYIYPQQITPPPALAGVTEMLSRRLNEEQQVVGHATLTFTSLWDGLDCQPRLWTTDLSFGSNALFGALGTAAVLTNAPPLQMPLSLLPMIPEGSATSHACYDCAY